MPVNFTQTERTRLLQFLNYGIRTAVNAIAIANHMGYPIGGNQVKTRTLITECIEHDQDLIASTLKKSRGYYKIRRNNIQELNDYLDSLENRAREINNRRTNLINNWNAAVPANQTNRNILLY
ncbi:MAG: hypothetical protein QM764_23045 [Chitinophagaceae bacterium]